ncbi:hypothetical protein Trydic_g7212 [Trypoxylus dichotomus]
MKTKGTEIDKMASIIRLFPVLSMVFSILLALASGLKTFFDSTVKRPGEDFIAGCGDDNYTISWSGPSGPLSSKTEPQVEESPYATLLYFRKATEKDSGNYTCSTEVDSKVVNILIKLPLDFVDTPSLQTAVEFQSQFVIKCEVKGGIKPTLSWYTAEGEVTRPKLTVLADGLLIRNVAVKDAGIYICKATERFTGALKEKTIMLKVEHKPYAKDGTVWAKHEPAWGFLGSVVNLTCEAIAEPAPRFEWHQPIKNHGIIFNTTEYASVMQVNITNEKVFGNYTCKVFNKHGYLFKTIKLEAGERPQPPELVAEQAENSDLIIITILPPSSPTGLMAPIGFIVKYRLVDPRKPHGNGWKESYFNISSKNSYTLKRLEAKSRYEVKAATKNVAGLSEFTNSTIFITLENTEGERNEINIALRLFVGESSYSVVWIDYRFLGYRRLVDQFMLTQHYGREMQKRGAWLV